MRDALKLWVKTDRSPRAKALRGKGDAYFWRIVLYVEAHTKHADTDSYRPPSDDVMASELRCSKDQARRCYELAKELFAPGGPWHALSAHRLTNQGSSICPQVRSNVPPFYQFSGDI